MNNKLRKKTWFGSVLAIALTAAGPIALTSPKAVEQATPQQASIEEARPAKGGPIKTVTKVVGRAVTTLRPVIQIVERAPQVPAGRIRPCTEGSPAPDNTTIGTSIGEFIATYTANQAAADAAIATAQAAISRFIDQTTEASDATATLTTDALRELLWPYIRSQLLNRMTEEAQECPEYVERVVTEVITQLRPEPESPQETSGN